MEIKLSLREVLSNIANGNQSPVEKFLLKKFGPKDGLALIKFLSDGEVKNEEYKIKFSKVGYENSPETSYTIDLKDLKNKELGKINYNIYPEDPRYIRMAFSENHDKDDLQTLNAMLQLIDEIAMKIEAKLVDAPYPFKSEVAIYRQHKYEPFTNHPSEKSDYVYNKYDIKHCKTNMLGLFDSENENA